MTVINKPGFYTSKAGKCEVVAIKDEYAIGWDWSGHGAIWNKETGQNKWMSAAYDITGPYVEPRKPVEAWAVEWTCMTKRDSIHFESNRQAAEAFLDRFDCRGEPRLIHLREVEDEKP